ncbi:uncharacterized protein G6M90_00g038170 [Metarhizium brunneum]|uniref:Uncharacterized protein n=1 Tax=Metarhizium brunneum TaxID=500148 RepID=A0A7D5Z139_9HYPO
MEPENNQPTLSEERMRDKTPETTQLPEGYDIKHYIEFILPYDLGHGKTEYTMGPDIVVLEMKKPKKDQPILSEERMRDKTPETQLPEGFKPSGTCVYIFPFDHGDGKTECTEKPGNDQPTLPEERMRDKTSETQLPEGFKPDGSCVYIFPFDHGDGKTESSDAGR